MLNEALQVAHRRHAEKQEQEKVAELLSQLPLAVLREIAETGTVKLAYGEPMSDGQSGGWVTQFKGTPFFQQAIALEQEDLQAQMANQQEQKLQRQKSDAGYEQMDQVRLKKKLLELQKARNEAQVLDGGAGPPTMTGDPTPMAPDAQGNGALGNVPSEGIGKMAGSGKYDALKAVGAVTAGTAALGGLIGKSQHEEYKRNAKEHPKSGLAQFAGKHPGTWGALSGGGTGALMGGLALRKHVGHELGHAGRDIKNVARGLGDKVKEHTVGKVRAAAGKKDINETTDKALAMVKAKPKGGEKKASVVKAAMSQNLLSTLKETAKSSGGAAMAGLEHGNVPRAFTAPTNVKKPMTGADVGAVKSMARKGTLIQNAPAPAARVRPLEVASDPFAKAAAAKIEEADAWGRELARADFQKIARANEVFSTGESVGRLMAKSASGIADAGKGLLNWAVAHPQQAGAAVGGAAGAAHGLLKQDGGIGSAVAEGAAGAGLGHAAGGIAGGMRGGNTLKDSAKMYGAHVHNEAGKLSDKVRAAWKDTPKPEAALGSGAQVQKADGG